MQKLSFVQIFISIYAPSLPTLTQIFRDTPINAMILGPGDKDDDNKEWLTIMGRDCSDQRNVPVPFTSVSTKILSELRGL